MHEAIPVRDFEAPNLSGQGSISRLMRHPTSQQATEDSPSKFSAKITVRKFKPLRNPNNQDPGGSILDNKLHPPTVKNLSCLAGINGVGGGGGSASPMFRKGGNETSSTTIGGLTHQVSVMDVNSQNSAASKPQTTKQLIDGPSRGQLQTKLELIEQKSRDFKEYLKIQLQEVHENHMKDKFLPYNRIMMQSQQ